MKREKVFSTDGALFGILKKNCVRKNSLSLLKYEEPLGNSYDNRDKQASFKERVKVFNFYPLFEAC